MVVSKRQALKASNIILFFYIVFFPFGQLLSLHLGTSNVTIHLEDIIVGLTLPIFFFSKIIKPKIYKYILYFILTCLFSSVMSLSYFPTNEVLVGSLYLLRFVSYVTFFVLTWNLVQARMVNWRVLVDSLIAVSVFVGIFGLIQYFWLPDLTSLKYLGWDDHLNRLVGTFLDPTFTGIILTSGLMLAISRWKKSFFYKIGSLLLLISLLLTYSRASYLAFVVGIFYLLWKRVRYKLLASIIFVFIFLIAFLPRPGGEGVRLERTVSISSRIANYEQTYTIIKNFPVFGVGFDNICGARSNLFLGKTVSHSCYGSDSSLLLVIATTGVVGFLIFVNLLIRLWNNFGGSRENIAGKAVLLGIFVHSFFSNTLFYPFVMGYMVILFSTVFKNNNYEDDDSKG